MLWRQPTDIGTKALNDIYHMLRVTNYWCVDEERGFLWWPGDYRQHVWANEGVFRHSTSYFRLHAETDLLLGRHHAEDFEVWLATHMQDATLSSVVYDEETDMYRMHSSVYFTEENAPFLTKLFLSAVGLQACETYALAQQLQTELKASTAVSAHPNHGFRNEKDPVLGIVGNCFLPQGQRPSAWLGKSEWQEAYWAIERLTIQHSTDRASWLCASFAWPDVSLGTGLVELHATAEDVHPILGNGLGLSLRLPIKAGASRLSHLVRELDSAERDDWRVFPMLGSWCVWENQLIYRAFVPNTAYNPHALEYMVVGMANRAEWVHDYFANHSGVLQLH